jgi:2-amino-4-hydroxy-6-hydroxymethyldihydropteridine diphosphokinase
MVREYTLTAAVSGTAYIGLGSNLGERRDHLARALARLDEETRGVTATSGLYETQPLYVLDQPPFLNAAARLESALSPHELLALLAALEQEAGRRRTRRFGPRSLDLDILLLGHDGALVVRTPELTVPHPRLLERAFALAPLAEVAADLVHPLCGRTLADLASAAPAEGVFRVAGPGWAERSARC